MTTEYIGQKPLHASLPNWLRGQATPMEGWVLWCLQSHFPNIHPSLNLLAQEACMSRRAVCTVLAGIERKGWLVREQAFTESGRQTATRYRLTIWDPRWALEEGASGALVQEVHSRRGAGGALGGVHDVHGEGAGGALKEDQSKKINSKKSIEPPLPPTARGERRPEVVAVPACRDRDGFLLTDPEPHAAEPAAVQPQPQQRPQPQSPPRPQPEPPGPEAVLPVKPKAQKREAGFVPAHEDVPAALLPVVRELLAFWASKGGKRTGRAWSAQLGQLERIQDDPTGGTEAVRAQLEAGSEAAVFGKPWQAVTFANWQRYGQKATPVIGSGFNRRPSPEAEAAAAIAFIRDRDAKAAAAAAKPQQAVLVEVLA